MEGYFNKYLIPKVVELESTRHGKVDELGYDETRISPNNSQPQKGFAVVFGPMRKARNRIFLAHLYAKATRKRLFYSSTQFISHNEKYIKCPVFSVDFEAVLLLMAKYTTFFTVVVDAIR